MGKTLPTAIIIGLLVACGGETASDSSNGAMFRANLQRTGVYPSKAVRELTELKWKFMTQGYFGTSPAVSKGVIYFGREDHSEDVGYLHAVDIETGQEKWNFKTAGKDKDLSAPSIADGVAYFGSGDNHLYAIDVQTGQEKWRFRTGGNVLSSPAIVDNVAYFGSGDGYLYAVDIKTGQEKWKFKTETESKSRYRGVESSPAIADGVIYFGSYDKHLYAVDIQTGTKKWKFKTGAYIDSSPAVADGMVYFGSNGSMSEDKPFLYAIDAFTGLEIWKFELGEYDIPSSPCISSGIVYFIIDRYSMYARRGVQSKNTTHLYAFDAKSGELLWKLNMGMVEGHSPTVADGVVYVGVSDLFAVDAIAGELLWQFKTAGSVRTSPAIVDGVVYFGDTAGWLYAVR